MKPPHHHPDWPSVRALRALHLSSAAVHGLWLALAAEVLPRHEVGVPVQFWPAVYSAEAQAVRIAHPQPRADFTFRSLLVLLAFPAVTAGAHLLYAALPAAGARGNPWRFAEYGVTATLITLSAAVDAGANDADSFALIVALSVALQAAGLGLELQPRGDPAVRGSREALLFIGFLAVGAMFFVIVRHAFTISAPPGAPEFSKAVAVAYGIYYFSFGAVAALRAYDVGPWRGAAWTEFSYVLLSLSSKSALFWLSFAGVKRMIIFLTAPNGAPAGDADWLAVQTAAAIAPAAVAIIGFAAAAWARPKETSKHQRPTVASHVTAAAAARRQHLLSA